MAEIIISILLAIIGILLYNKNGSKKQDEKIKSTKEKFVKNSNELNDLIEQYKRIQSRRDRIRRNKTDN